MPYAQFSHIYVVLGWPPFKPQAWASAETTISGAPLGYDVVMHGLKPFNEVISAVPSGAGPSSLGGVVEVVSDQIGTEIQKTKAPNWVKNLPWEGIISGVIQGVITTLIVRWAINIGEKRARSKR